MRVPSFSIRNLDAIASALVLVIVFGACGAVVYAALTGGP